MIVFIKYKEPLVSLAQDISITIKQEDGFHLLLPHVYEYVARLIDEFSYETNPGLRSHGLRNEIVTSKQKKKRKNLSREEAINREISIDDAQGLEDIKGNIQVRRKVLGNSHEATLHVLS